MCAALAGVEAFERFVEHDDLRVVDERGGDLDALAHALGVGADRAAVVGVEFDQTERAARGARRRARPWTARR